MHTLPPEHFRAIMFLTAILPLPAGELEPGTKQKIQPHFL